MKDITESDLKERIPLSTRKTEDQRTAVKVGEVVIGGDRVVVIAGPCAVENEEQVLEIAQRVKAAGASILRGGAYKPLTFPYRTESFFELREVGLKYLSQAGKATGLPVVTEVMDTRLVETVARHADILQIGARNMQNFPLLEEVAKTHKPVLLKRHFGSSLRDWLGAAEYILYGGNPNVILCERGVIAPHTHAVTSRFIVDIQAIPAVKEYSHLPVIVDPSHATFKRKYVGPVARAAIAAGADGLIMDVHPVPEKAAVDPLQALSYESFGLLMQELRGIASILGRSI
jgi:3-deoxy-7-phosphoheptulonate synthase